jgi:YfiH family protein
MPFVYSEVNGVGYYEVSAWVGARGVFTTRKGGLSQRPFDSLNLGYGGGDDPGVVAKNRALLVQTLGLPGDIKAVHQVHGSDVYILKDRNGAKPLKGYDAIITALKGVPIGVLTADCVPILLYDPVKQVVGAVHAGWKGTVGGVPAKAVKEMSASFGCHPTDIRAGIGPSIGPCCYEVEDNVVVPLHKSVGRSCEDLLSPSRPGHWQFDLWKTNHRTLLLAGLRPENINVFGVCTSCNTDKFFSHRKSGGSTGRMFAIAQLSEDGGGDK